jgi:mitochondrial fission protein ELM1
MDSQSTANTRDNIVTILTMTPFTGVNHSLLGVSNALTPARSFEIRPSVSKNLIDAFKTATRDNSPPDAEARALISAAAEGLEQRFDFIEGLRRSNETIVIVNHGNNTKRVLQALALKHALSRALLVNINHPGIAPDQFDLTVMAPSQRKPLKDLGHLLPVGSVPNQISHALLHQARMEWQPALRRSGRRLIAVLIGGDVGKKHKANYHPFTPDHARDVISYALAAAQQTDADLAISTSRRTPPDVLAFIETMIAGSDLAAHGRAPLLYAPSQHSGANPYLGLLACADAIIVTADSLSMLSEAVDSCKPVFAARLDSLLRHEHRALYDHLLAGSHIFEIPTPIHFNPGMPILSASVVRREIMRMIEAQPTPVSPSTQHGLRETAAEQV